MASQGFGSWRHLAGRFFGALSPAGPRRKGRRLGAQFPVGGGADLWGRMSGPDRRHAVEVARETIRLLDEGTPPQEGSLPREVVAAALLHDVGKVESGLGTFARVGVTLAAMAAGRVRLLRWSGSSVPRLTSYLAGADRHVPRSRPPGRRVPAGCRQQRADLLPGHENTTWPRARWTVDNTGRGRPQGRGRGLTSGLGLTPLLACCIVPGDDGVG